MSLLITRPYYEKTTHYLYYWAGKIIDEAKRTRLSFFDLDKKDANKKKFESYLKKHNPTIIILNGHGNAFSVAGQDGEVIVSDENIDLLKDASVFIRACQAGKVLGQMVIEKGARGFVGYKEDFIFLIDKEMVSRPLEDELAKPFLECSNQVALSLVRGASTKDAHQESLKLYKKKIDEMLTSKSTNSNIIPFLLWNMVNQVCL